MAKFDQIGKVVQLELLQTIKGWPVKGADTVQEATTEIFGSPFWDIPQDLYQTLDCNETYCLIAVVIDGERISRRKRYLVVNSDLLENCRKKEDIP